MLFTEFKERPWPRQNAILEPHIAAILNALQPGAWLGTRELAQRLAIAVFNDEKPSYALARLLMRRFARFYATHDGPATSTYGNPGIAWRWRLLSKESPAEAGPEVTEDDIFG